MRGGVQSVQSWIEQKGLDLAGSARLSETYKIQAWLVSGLKGLGKSELILARARNKVESTSSARQGLER